MSAHPILLLLLSVIVSCSSRNINQSAKQAKTCFVSIEDLQDPISINDQTALKNRYYDVIYDNVHAQPLVVVYKLKYSTATHNLNRGDDYSNRFLPDVRVTRSANDKSYLRTGWQKGHLAPAEDFSFSVEAARETFLYSNVSPQFPSFNMHGSWAKLEKKVRYISEKQEIQVLTGPMEFENSKTNENENSPHIPKFFYKIIISETNQRCYVSAFVLKNDSSSKDFCKDNIIAEHPIPSTITKIFHGKEHTNDMFCPISLRHPANDDNL